MRKLLVIATLLVFLVSCATTAPSPAPPTPAEKAKPAADTGAAPKPKEAEAKPAAPAAKQAEAKPAAPATKQAEAKPAAPKPTQAVAKAPAKLDKIKLVYTILGAGTAPIWIAYDEGIFKKNGLDVEMEFSQNTANAAKALAGGQFQFATMGGEIPVRLTVSGTPTVLLSVTTNYMVFALFGNPKLTKPEDLKGGKVGVTQFGSGTDVATRAALRKYGLEPDRDYAIIQTGGMAQGLAAVLAGGIDASTFGHPMTLQAKKAGLKELIDITTLQIPFGQNGIGVTRDYLSKNEDVVRRFVKSYVEAIALAKNNKAAAKKALVKYGESQDEEVLEDSYNLWITKIIPQAPYPSAAALQQGIDTVAVDDEKAKTYKPEAFIESRFIKELEDSGFIKSLYEKK